MHYVPAQEIILVWVFVINLHLQLLTRDFMDNDLMHQTHTRTWKLTGTWGRGGRWQRPHVNRSEKRGISIASPIYLIRLRKTKMEWRWLPSFTWNSRNQTTSHLVRLVPLGRVGVVLMFGGEMLRADPCYGIRVGQAGHHPFHVAVLSCQVLGLQQVDPHHSL